MRHRPCRKSTTGSRLLRSAPALLLLLVALGACDDDTSDQSSGGSASSGASAQAPSAGSETAPEPASPPESAEADAAEVAEPATGADCIVGSWLLDNDSFAALMAEIDPRANGATTGVARFRASADGSAVTEYEAWTHVMTVPEGVMTLVRDGRDAGQWAARPDGTISLDEQVINSTVDVEMYSGGQTMTLPQMDGSPSELHQGVFTCTADVLTVTVDGLSSTMLRE